MGEVPDAHQGWTFLTNHARVLTAIARDQTVRIRDIAARCRLTERAVQKIISDLEAGGYLAHTRQGRSNTYSIEPGKYLRHPADAGPTVAELLSLLAQHDGERTPRDGERTPRDGEHLQHDGRRGGQRQEAWRPET